MVCRACGNAALRPCLRVREWRLDMCGGCGYIQVMPLPSAESIVDIYGPSYFDKGKYCDDEAGRREQRRRMTFLTAVGVRDGARILDFGFATGEFLLLARQRWQCWGVELSAAAVAEARAAMPEIAERLAVGGVEDIGCPEGFFDAIVLWDVIEHLPGPAEILRQLAVKLRPGGVLVISTPDIGTLTARILRGRWHFMTPPEHLGFFDRRSLSALMRGAGLIPGRRMVRGKWANLAFIVYKIGRVFPGLVSKGLIDALHRGRLGKTCLYVPTGDVQYAAAHKQG